MKRHEASPDLLPGIVAVIPRFRRLLLSSVSLLPADTPSVTILPVRPWPDSVIDALGHDPRSAYVERFWLGILGPSTTWLLRYLAAAPHPAPARLALHPGDHPAPP